MNTMEDFERGLERGYALAVDDLRNAIEAGSLHRKHREGLALLEGLSFEVVERWLEDSSEAESRHKGGDA